MLTKKEKIVIKCIGEGLSNPAIAKKLCLSETTIKSHIHNISKKYGISKLGRDYCHRVLLVNKYYEMLLEDEIKFIQAQNYALRFQNEQLQKELIGG